MPPLDIHAPTIIGEGDVLGSSPVEIPAFAADALVALPGELFRTEMHHAWGEEAFLVDPGAGQEREGSGIGVPVNVLCCGAGVEGKLADGDAGRGVGGEEGGCGGGSGGGGDGESGVGVDESIQR
jgi:hypothetical protein